MTVEVRVPRDLWEEEGEAAITNWLADDGAQVHEGDLISEIMVEKIQYEIHAPADGRLRILKQINEVVGKGTLVACID